MIDPSHGRPREVILLGATGSIGTQAVDLLRRYRDRFRLTGLAATGRQPRLLADQAVELAVGRVAVSDPASAPAVRAALDDAGGRAVRLTVGPAAVSDLAAHPADVVLNGITGAAGLAPTLAALRAGNVLALANKESLIMGGPLVAGAAGPGQLVPVDSEHSALAQCLRAGRAEQVGRLILTASGGPFRGRRRAELADVTPAEAMAHPTWDMGPVITTNSATLVNKGLEVIEAHLLFGIGYERIDVVVHPQSIVHSLVEFVDGSMIAQCSPPDMRLPIALALAWPDRLPGAVAGVDLAAGQRWEFDPLDDEAFPAVALARHCGRSGQTYPAVYNAANEECVAAFHGGRLGFLEIVDTVADVVKEHSPAAGSLTVDGVLAADAWARQRAQQLIEGSS